MHALDALLWLGLQGDPLVSLIQPRGDGRGRPAWTVALDVLPASLLVIELGPTYGRVARARLHGSDGALRACTAAMDAWRAAGTPGPSALELTVDPVARPHGVEPAVPRARRRGDAGPRRAPLDAALRPGGLTRPVHTPPSLVRRLHYCAVRSSVRGT